MKIKTFKKENNEEVKLNSTEVIDNGNLLNLSIESIKGDIISLNNKINQDKSLTENGYYKLPNGLILQWGINYSAGITVQQYQKNIPYNISFPNACFNVQVTINDVGYGGSEMYYGISMASKNKDNFNITLKTTRTGINYSVYTYWFAIGY